MNIDFSKSICGYRLQELLCLKNSSYGLGWNPASNTPYATWKIVCTGQYWDFHVFQTLHEARQDLFARSMQHFTQPELLDLLPKTLSDEERDLLLKALSREIINNKHKH